MVGRDIFVLFDGTGCDRGTNTNIHIIEKTVLAQYPDSFYRPGTDKGSSIEGIQKLLSTEVFNNAYTAYFTLLDVSKVTENDRLYMAQGARSCIFGLLKEHKGNK